ncbi:MAG: hypothetical protein FJ290_31420, partial [Planctomycetes bacterium]|nr:hypothetical protein [Planctomycetota bacterium]
ADLPEGSYQVRAHNHTGEAWGWSEPLPLEVRKPGPEPKRFDVRDFGAKGDGKSDDTAALQKALDAAGKSAPAVLVLPPGTFPATRTLDIPPAVTVRGSGMRNTIVRPGEGPPSRPGKPERVGRVLLSGRTGFALEDLAVTGAEGWGLLLVKNDQGGPSERVAVRRCALEAAEGGQGVFVGRARRLAIDHCELRNVGTWTHELRECYFGFNRVGGRPKLSGGSFGMGPRSTNVVVEHNTFVALGGWDGTGGLVGPGGARNLLVAGNSVERATGPGFAASGAGVRWRGPAQCPDAGTVVTPGKKWGLGGEAPDSDLTGCVVVVVSGRGMGQWRDVAAAEGDTVRLAKLLAVVPDGSSELCIARASVANSVVCNVVCERSGRSGGFLGAGAINCTIEGIQSVGTDAVAITTGAAPDLFNQIICCRIFDGSGIHLGAEDDTSCLQLGSVVARNEVLRLAHGVSTAVVVDGPARFAGIEGNRVANCWAAVGISPKAFGTLVRRNRMVGIERGPISDRGAESIVTGFTDKAGFHDYWPQGLNVLQLFKGKP